MALSELDRTKLLDETVLKLASECPVSGNSGYSQLDYYGFTNAESYVAPWKSFKDKRILDIGTGVSDFVEILLQKGADAYAFDFGYLNMDTFLENIQGRGGWTPDPLFLRSVRRNPDRYIGGLANNLPFESESFDGVASHFGIFGVLDSDFGVLKSSIREVIRVLKEDGVCKIGPFHGGSGVTDEQKRNQKRLVEELNERTDVFVSAAYPRALGSRAIEKLGQITIMKTA